MVHLFETLSNKTIAASQVTEISNLTAVEGAQLENIGSTTISASQWGYLGGATSFGGSLLDDANAAAGRTTLGVDAAGTDNSTDVTLVTTSHDYLSISGQAVTLAAIDLTADVTGDLPVTEGGTGASNASGARSNLGVDAAGTDNSTNVTLAGKDYLTISSQEITANAIDLTDDVSGTLPTGNLPIASGAAVITGTATTSLVTPDKLAAKTVVADIDVSSINSTNKYAEITHSLGMADIMVQIYDTVTEETVYADVARTTESVYTINRKAADASADRNFNFSNSDLTGYLTSGQIEENFLRKTDAASQYLTQSDASTTYSAKSGAIYSGTHNFNTASSVTVPTLATSATGQNVASVDWVRDYTTPLFDAKAPLAAPTLSGTVTLSSAIPSSQADTRAVHANWVRGFVNPLVDLKANKDSAVFTTSVTLPANFPATDSNGQDAASTNWVRSYTSPLFDEKANLAGGAAFSGTVTAPTATKNDDTIKLATTSFVQNEFSQMNKNLIPKAMTSGDIQYSGEQFIANKGYLRNPAGFSPSTGRPQYTYRGKNIGGPNEYWANLYVGEIHVSDASIRMGDGDSQAVLQSTNTGGLVLPGEVALGGEGNTIPTNLASTEMDKAYASTTRPSVLKINFTVDSDAAIPYENGTYPVFLNANGNIDFMISRAGIGDAYKNFVGFVDHSGTVGGQTLEVQVQGLLAANFSGAAVYSIPFADTVASNASANEALTFSFGGATAIVDLYDESGSAPRYTGLSDATLLTELNAQLTAQSIPFTATITSDNSGFTFTHSTVGAVATPTSAITGLATFTDTAGSFITNPATTYTIVSTGGTVTDTAGSFATSDEYTIVSVGTATDTAGAFTTSTEYTIVSVGTTDFTTIGAADNTVGTVFTATGTGTGTGTASRISTDFTTIGAADNNIGTVFTATGVGSGTGTATRLSTNFKLIGAANNTIGTTFTATGVGSGAGTASRIGTTSVSIIVSTVTNGSSFTAGNEVHINSTGDFLTAAGSSTAKIGKAVSISQLFLYSINTIPEYVQSQVKVDLNSFSVNPSATPSGPGSLAYNNTNGQLTFTPPKQIADADLTGTPTVPTATAGTDTTQAASTAFVKAAIDALVAAAPETLDTLNEIAAAINNEGNFAATVARLASPTFTGTVTVPEPAAASDNQTVATTAFVRSTAPSLVDAALAGVPTAPTAALHTETTQIATTEFVATAIARGGGSSNLDGGLANTTRTLATHHFDGGNAS